MNTNNQEAFNKRIPFYLDESNNLKVANNKYSTYTHVKWFAEIGVPYLFTIRGYYYPDIKYVSVYWNDFEIPNMTLPYLTYLFEHFSEAECIGIGCNKGKVGEIWEPKLKVYNK